MMKLNLKFYLLMFIGFALTLSRGSEAGQQMLMLDIASIQMISVDTSSPVTYIIKGTNYDRIYNSSYVPTVSVSGTIDAPSAPGWSANTASCIQKAASYRGLSNGLLFRIQAQGDWDGSNLTNAQIAYCSIYTK